MKKFTFVVAVLQHCLPIVASCSTDENSIDLDTAFQRAQDAIGISATLKNSLRLESWLEGVKKEFSSPSFKAILRVSVTSKSDAKVMIVVDRSPAGVTKITLLPREEMENGWRSLGVLRTEIGEYPITEYIREVRANERIYEVAVDVVRHP